MSRPTPRRRDLATRDDFRAVLLALLILGAPGPEVAVRADEGMWLLNDLPRKHLTDRYNFDLSSASLEHAQKASVRFNNGGSGGFVSTTRKRLGKGDAD